LGHHYHPGRKQIRNFALKKKKKNWKIFTWHVSLPGAAAQIMLLVSVLYCRLQAALSRTVTVAFSKF
jgi:hypothetical protein